MPLRPITPTCSALPFLWKREHSDRLQFEPSQTHVRVPQSCKSAVRVGNPLDRRAERAGLPSLHASRPYRAAIAGARLDQGRHITAGISGQAYQALNPTCRLLGSSRGLQGVAGWPGPGRRCHDARALGFQLSPARPGAALRGAGCWRPHRDALPYRSPVSRRSPKLVP